MPKSNKNAETNKAGAVIMKLVRETLSKDPNEDSLLELLQRGTEDHLSKEALTDKDTRDAAVQKLIELIGEDKKLIESVEAFVKSASENIGCVTAKRRKLDSKLDSG